MNLILAHHPVDQLVPLCDNIQDLYEGFIRELSSRVSLQHAALFAKPKYIKDTIFWHADGQNFVPLKSLPEAQQKEIIHVTRSILIDIACIARLSPNSTWSSHFSYFSRFPSLDYVYVVDGRPVITGWGYAGINGYYDPLQSDTTKIKKTTNQLTWSKFPWVTSSIVLFLGILISLLWHVTQHSDKVCYATYPLVKEVEDALKGQDNNKILNKKRDALLKSLDTLKTQCKIPPVKAEPPQSAPESKPQKTIDLPKESWNKKEVSMLDGCWNLTTPITLISKKTRKIIPVKSWQVCFNEAGQGYQTIEMANGATCKGLMSAHFQGTKIMLEQPEYCDGGFTLAKGNHTCTRTNDSEASCIYRNNEDRDSEGSLGIFKR